MRLPSDVKKKKSTKSNEIAILDHRKHFNGWKKVAAVVRSIYISAIGKDGGGSVSRKDFTGDKAGLSGT